MMLSNSKTRSIESLLSITQTLKKYFLLEDFENAMVSRLASTSEELNSLDETYQQSLTKLAEL